MTYVNKKKWVVVGNRSMGKLDLKILWVGFEMGIVCAGSVEMIMICVVSLEMGMICAGTLEMGMILRRITWNGNDFAPDHLKWEWFVPDHLKWEWFALDHLKWECFATDHLNLEHVAPHQFDIDVVNVRASNLSGSRAAHKLPLNLFMFLVTLDYYCCHKYSTWCRLMCRHKCCFIRHEQQVHTNWLVYMRWRLSLCDILAYWFELTNALFVFTSSKTYLYSSSHWILLLSQMLHLMSSHVSSQFSFQQTWTTGSHEPVSGWISCFWQCLSEKIVEKVLDTVTNINNQQALSVAENVWPPMPHAKSSGEKAWEVALLCTASHLAGKLHRNKVVLEEKRRQKTLGATGSCCV